MIRMMMTEAAVEVIGGCVMHRSDQVSNFSFVAVSNIPQTCCTIQCQIPSA